MQFELTEEQEAIRAGVRELCAAFPDEYWAEKDQAKEFPWEFHHAAAEGGWLGMCFAEEYGGAGLGLTEACIAVQEVAASGGCNAGSSIIHTAAFGLMPVQRHGSQEMKARVLPKVASGEMMLAFAITEPTTGSETTRTKTFARRVDGGYRISGQKVWITKAMEASRFILLARTIPYEEVEKKSAGLTLFLAPNDPDAIEIRPIRKMGRNAGQSCELFIDELYVADEDVIGEPNRGFHALLDGFNAERILISHELIGIGRASLRRACDYARERVVYNRPIGLNQGIQFPLAEALARLDAAELLAWKAASMYDRELPCGREANTALLLSQEAGFYAADRALQTHGGYGYAVEYHVERYFREAKLLNLGPISPELIRAYLAEHVLGLPRSY